MRRAGGWSLGGMWVSVMVVVLVMVMVGKANGDLSPSQCKQEKDLLVKECKNVIFGQNPSQSCCQRVRVTHVECVCPLVTPKLANLINVQRTFKQIAGCGRTMPHHFKCGTGSSKVTTSFSTFV
ncbi:hypothetical protein FNV43_RR24329 [Rhamnella rubrinervis]|uniref:Bifunctional inhibitor/plant lipid transfer protein/seed storage helical domain-containing protein n=1 Tax=Rhamnella rubrinervis TaxID=2594499 RepID=A0A8K0GL39_9ROSA|nr:hypothetical protein FNV43_RR24329 [Rhamnella rubrinervis]